MLRSRPKVPEFEGVVYEEPQGADNGGCKAADE